MNKLKICIVQIVDDNILRKIDSDIEIQNILSLCINMKNWCDHNGYDHYVHYLTDTYKESYEFNRYMYNDYTKIKVHNIDQNGHSKVFGFIKSLEYLKNHNYDYVCMLDVDISYVHKNRSIEDYIESTNTQDKHIIAALECIDPVQYYNGKNPNGGVYLFKNTSWTKRLLEGLVNAQTRIGYSNHKMTQCLNDQMQMSFIAMTCPECDEKFFISQHTDAIQKWFSPGNYKADVDNYKSIFFHFAGSMKRNIPLYYDELELTGEQVIRDYIHYKNFLIEH